MNFKKSLYCLWIYIFISLIFFSCQKVEKKQFEDSYISAIDSLIESTTVKPFNGVVLMVKDGKQIYSKTQGFANREKKIPLTPENQFVIGSISKQITAVMILQEYEKGSINLNEPIRTYFPNVKQKWADSVTVHHLLTHTHGIRNLNEPLAFPLGSKFEYSQLGFKLLANILENVKKQSFEEISTTFFKTIGLKHTAYPSIENKKMITAGYTETESGNIIYEENTFQNYVAAGSFISTAQDLVKWNTLLHNGKLLKNETFKLMTKQYETRKHPIFGSIEYGYGLTFQKNEQDIQIGALGFAPGFVSSNFYFPQTKTSLIILENTAYKLPNFKKTFYHHTELLKTVKNNNQPN
ncbi:serine hydrolase domain-containing protein [Bernardetia sp.]|uniref:serine hydrolase domain-containing protein n=1 Tax=Bernardetia sp. TaxID=1937974 RepID=UPI0025BA9ECF|nr:serine hydrolase domain-containing protein [Bernardetia sp.]